MLAGTFAGVSRHEVVVHVDAEIRGAVQPVNSRSAKRPSPERAALPGDSRL